MIDKIYELNISELGDEARDVNFREVWNDAQSIGVELKIRSGGVLARHSALQPIKVLCLSGDGRFAAGDDLETEAELHRGTVIALSAGIPHEVTAQSELHVLVTKFK